MTEMKTSWISYAFQLFCDSSFNLDERLSNPQNGTVERQVQFGAGTDYFCRNTTAFLL